MKTARFLGVLAAGAMMSLASMAPAQAIELTAEIISGDAITPSSNFVVRVSVSQNTTDIPSDGGELIDSAAIFVGFDTANCTFDSVAPVTNGVIPGPETWSAVASGSDTTQDIGGTSTNGRRISSFGSAAAAGSDLFDITFTVAASPSAPYSILLDTDEDSSNPITYTYQSGDAGFPGIADVASVGFNTVDITNADESEWQLYD